MIRRMMQPAAARLMTVVGIVLVMGVAGTVALLAANNKPRTLPVLAVLTLNDAIQLAAFESELIDQDNPDSPTFSLRVKFQLVSTADFTKGHGFKRGNEFGAATLAVLDQALVPMATYTLTGNLRIQAVRYTSNQATNPPQFFEEIVLLGISYSAVPVP